ncbi:MAG: rhodanese-like domain-containing protein [Acidobacteriota bacterium]
MTELIDLLSRYGLAAVFFNVLLEQIGLPIPALPLFVVAGAMAADGKLSAPGALGWAILASLIADGVWFGLGRRQGARVLRTVCRISISPDTCVKRMEWLYERFGLPSLLFAKFVPGYSTVAPPLAGALGAGAAGFLLFDAAGALLWAGSAIGAGMIFHRAIDRLLALLEGLGSLGLGLVGVAFVAWVVYRFIERRRFVHELRLARISVPELQRMLGAADAPLVFDVRTSSAAWLDQRRIPGSLRLSFDEIERTLAGESRAREVVLYCT